MPDRRFLSSLLPGQAALPFPVALRGRRTCRSVWRLRSCAKPLGIARLFSLCRLLPCNPILNNGEVPVLVDMVNVAHARR